MSKVSTLRGIIFTSSLGTLIEWYDFYIFGMLAKSISAQFFPEGDETTALLSTLAIFAAGFLVRPFGALFFGRLGDLIGRKSTFLLTLILMGGSTFLIGLIPGYKSIGLLAPILVLLLRLLQGLALGGEYGGAATYVAEHSPKNKRGFYTSWIQTTATLGLFISLGIIMAVKSSMSEAAFNAEWGGWRYPFWISIFLVVVSVYIRLKMSESPLFTQLKHDGKISKNPIKESFGKKDNFKMVLLALFGAVMGQGVIWYTAQFYAQSFLENTAKLDFMQSREILLWAIAFGTPFYIFFGALSDRIGRKWIMIAGMLLGALFFRPIFNVFIEDTQIEKDISVLQSQATVINSISIKTDTISLTNRVVTTSQTQWQLVDGKKVNITRSDTLLNYQNGFQASLVKDSKPVISNKIIPADLKWKFILLVWIMIVFVTMVYGPIAAFLVELFPTQIRYTSMSLPYHIGNGVFGGLVPFISTLLSVSFESDPLVGLWYPIAVALLSAIIGILYLKNQSGKNH
ncbi:MAG: MHS family MFS transporter [Ferruginibacter sp.]|nr:MHS family MFS transporter [Ferruginibacter sp.]